MAASLSNSASPISTLPQDILYHIFSLTSLNHVYRQWPKGNTSPLTITRRCSQVCATWRVLLLKSASIWANCIELDMLAQTSSAWRDEVLRRTGRAPLAIRVHRRNTVVRSGVMHALLATLLDQHWERVRVLHIAVPRPEDLQDPTILDALSRPAPRLEEFTMRSSEIGSEELVFPEGFCLFSNDAPVLTRFLLTFARPALPVGAHIFFSSPHLRELHLQQPIKISPGNLLAACAHLPSLEIFLVNIATLLPNDQCTLSFPRRISLPSLQKVDIISPTPTIYPAFLDRITTHPGCSFSINTMLDQSTRGLVDAIPANIKDMQRLFVQHAHCVIHHGCTPAVTVVLLTIHLNKINLVLSSWGTPHSRFNFTLKTASNADGIPYGILQSTLGAISSIAFPDSRFELVLTIFDISDDFRAVRSGRLEVDESDRPQPMLVQSVWRSLRAMRDVAELDISPRCLLSLVRLSESEYAHESESEDALQTQPLLFPSLRTIR